MVETLTSHGIPVFFISTASSSPVYEPGYSSDTSINLFKNTNAYPPYIFLKEIACCDVSVKSV